MRILLQYLNGTLWFLLAFWLGQCWSAWRGARRMMDASRMNIEDLPISPSTDGPQISILVPACNEEKVIAETIRSLLAQTGVRLEIVAINDRSTDGTGRILDEIAKEYAGPHCFRVIHNRALPEGWLGKPHALWLGAAECTADWLLLTDADMRFAPRALEWALRVALREKADHLCMIPEQECRGAGEAGVQSALMLTALWANRLWKVDDPRTRDFFGMGCFTLVRREALARVSGLEALRMQVTEDLALGWMVKHSGMRSRVVIGRELVRIRWITGWFGLVKLLEKNGFTVFGYSMGLCLAALLGVAIHVLIPLCGLATGAWGRTLAIYAVIVLTQAAVRRINGVSPWAALLFAPCASLVGFAVLRSMVLTVWRDGVTWRGTHYSLRRLRAQDFRRNPAWRFATRKTR